MTDLGQIAVIALALAVTTVAAVVVPQAAMQKQVVRTLGDELSDQEKAKQLRELSEYLGKLQDKADVIEEKADEKAK